MQHHYSKSSINYRHQIRREKLHSSLKRFCNLTSFSASCMQDSFFGMCACQKTSIAKQGRCSIFPSYGQMQHDCKVPVSISSCLSLFLLKILPEASSVSGFQQNFEAFRLAGFTKALCSCLCKFFEMESFSHLKY